jgi:hypothetical protein
MSSGGKNSQLWQIKITNGNAPGKQVTIGQCSFEVLSADSRNHQIAVAQKTVLGSR